MWLLVPTDTVHKAASLDAVRGQGEEGRGRAHRKGGESGWAREHSESFTQDEVE